MLEIALGIIIFTFIVIALVFVIIGAKSQLVELILTLHCAHVPPPPQAEGTNKP
jgi:Na+-transporting NADH:ubiquinone oxidoreductase subunit NqrF